MAKNILNIDNVKGIAKYGVNEYEKVKKKERRKRFEQYEKEDAWLDLSNFEDGYQIGDVSKSILGTGVKTAQNFTKGLQSNLEGFLDTGTNLLSMGTEKLGMDKTTNKLRQFAQKDFIADNDLVNKTLISTNPLLSLVNQGVRFKENLEDGYQVGDAIIKNNFAANLLSGQGTLSKGMDKLASNSITGNKLDSLTQTVGQIAGQATLGGTGIPWQLTAFVNSAGNEMNNAFQNNASSGQAFLSGLISGLVEVGTEYIGGGANKLLGMESLGSKGLAKLGSKISNKVVSRLAKIGIDASSEGLEEVLSGLGTAIGQKLTYMNDKDFNELYSSDQALDDFVMGALGTIITNVPGQVQSIRRGENAFSGLTENEQAILDKVIEERTNEAQKDGKELTKKQLNEIEDQAREDLQNGYISADMIEETLGDKFNADKDIVLREAFNERTRRRNTFDTDLNQYKNENQRKIVQKAIDSGILNDSKKTHNFVDLVSKIAADKGMDFDFTNNQRIKESGFGVEGKTVNGYVNGNTIGLNIESNNALNKTVGHEITHVLEGSDMYQALQDSLREYVGQEQWDKRIKELTETYKNVENADVSKELTADLVGENLFNNEDFVRSLSTKDRNLFEKIYDEIKYLVKIATAGSKEKRELVKLQKVFQEAYRDSKTTKEGTQYQLDEVQKTSNLGDYIADVSSRQAQQKEADRQAIRDAIQEHLEEEGIENPTREDMLNAFDTYDLMDASDEFNDYQKAEKLVSDVVDEMLKEKTKYSLTKATDEQIKEAKKLEKKGQNPEEIYLETGAFKGLDGKWRREIDDSKAKITIDSNDNLDYKTDLKDILDFPELYELYPNFADIKVRVGYMGEEAIGAFDSKSNTLYINQDVINQEDFAFKNSFEKIARETDKLERSKEYAKLLGINEEDYINDIREKAKQYDEYKYQQNLKSVLLHEIQHMIQREEGFARGSNLSIWAKRNPFTLNKDNPITKMNNYTDSIGLTSSKMWDFFSEAMDSVGKDATNEEMQNKYNELLENYIKENGDLDTYNKLAKERDLASKRMEITRGRTIEQLYKDTYGEQEARNVQERMEMTPELRKTTIPFTGNENSVFAEEKLNKKVYGVKFSLSEDNQGRQLSEQQQEYFKDSKVRDDEGNLLTVYHGTNADFNIFDKAKIGANTNNEGIFGKGFYFTENQDLAKGYNRKDGKVAKDGSGRTMELYLDMKKPFYWNEINTQEKMQQFIEETGMPKYVLQWNNTLKDQMRPITDIKAERKFTEVLQKNGYDGVIYKYDNTTGEYVIFDSKQAKYVDNTKPTENEDIRYQLETNEIAPNKGWEVRGEDIRLQNAIAPLQEQVSQLQDTINGIRDNLAPVEELKPITEEEANRLFDEIPFNPNEEAPLRYNLTPEESKRLDFLDRLERENMLTDNLAEEQRELRAKEENAPEYEKDMTPIESLNDVRDIDEVGDRKVNAYQYEHPEVKPFFQEEARKMLADLNNSTKGERYAIPGQSQNINDWEWIGAERQTSPEIEALLDGDLGVKYSYEDIRKGLNAIIEDHGAENIAVAKRIEFLLDDRLRNGYDVWYYGGILKDQYGNPIRIEPNQDYLNMLKAQSWDKYYESLPWQEEAPSDLIAPAEIEEPTIMMTPEEVSRNEVAPVRQDRDIMEMVDNEGVRKSTTKNQPPVVRKQRSALNNFVDEVQSLFVNRNRQVDNLSRESGNRNLKFLDDMVNGAMGEVNYDINTAQTNNQGEAIGKSIKGLFAEAKSKGLGEAFNDFLLNYSNIDRHRQGKGSQTPEHISKQLVRDYAIKYPEFKQWAKEVWNYGKNARQNLVEAGLIDQELADYLGKIYPHYVPYVSDFDNVDTYFEGVGELKPKAIKRARGGSGKLLSVEDALARYTYAQKNAVRTNNLYKEIVKTLGKVPNFGVDERTDYTNMRDSLFTDSRGNYLTAYENGKQITTQVSSDLYKELSKVNENQIKDFEKKLSLLTTPLQKVSEVRKNLITTWNPTFPITNAIKDIQDALFNSKHTMDMIKNYPSALKELATGKGKQVQQFMALYGSGLTMGEYSSDTMSQKTAKVPFLKRIRQANEIIELAPRYAEFKASLQKGESLQEAIYNAREITTNFGRGGTITKALNRNGFTFLNASVQGFDKLIRNFSGENGAKGIVQAMAKVAALGIAPALINHLAFGDDDEEYEALPNYIKDNYYLIKTDDENFIRIPKGRMLSIFGSAARRTLEASQGQENAFEGYLKNAWDQVGINDPGENNIFAPFIQAFGSENGQAWYGGDIVPTRLQDKLPEEQYDETTDKFSIWLGSKLGVSPKKINYVLDQYSGGIGDVLLPMGTEAATSKAETPLDFAIAPIRDKFTADSVNDNKYVSNFYSKREELGKIANSSKATEDDILQKKYLDDISKQMTGLYTEKREIQSDPELSKSEKYEIASEIKREINRLAKEGLDNYQNVKTTGDYSNVNGNEYQKTEEGWKKIKDDVSTEINSYGLTDSEKNTYFKTKSNISGIRNKYKDSKDYASKKADIVNEIRSANLPDDAKIGLYQDAYNDKMAQSYVDAGISADNYLDFKSQTFNADKDKDGKSISGSKKQKVFNYINSMDIPFEQKIILAKTEYPTYNDYNRQVIEYLNNSDIDREEMVDILKDLGFKVNGDNISW